MAREARPVPPTPGSVCEELLGHVESARDALRLRNVTDEHIHDARKHLKRARANLRLLQDAIGDRAYTRENAALRDAARPLSGVRDAKVLVETSDALIDRLHSRAPRTLLRKARRALEKARREARAELRVMNAAKDSVAVLDGALERMRKWRLGKDDPASLRAGLKRTYRRGRAAFDVARHDPTPENLHEWRKQVKYLEQSVRAWDSAKRAKTLRKRADTLADTLGTDHDLVVFEERLEQLDAPGPARPAVTRAIAARRRKLQKEALGRGRQLFQAKPRKLIRRTTAHA